MTYSLLDRMEEIPSKSISYEEEAEGYEPSDPWFPSDEELENWRSYFPMDKFRQWQELTIDSILKGWKSGKRYAIVEGPTGSGKSLLAITLGRLFKNSFVSTPQKMLQNQYMRDFSQYLFELKGRATYPCLRINYEKWEDGTGEFETKTVRGKQVKQERMSPRTPVQGLDYITLNDWDELTPEHPFKRYNCANAPCNTLAKGDKLKQECKQHDICEYIRRREYALRVSDFSLLNFSNLLLFSLLMPKVYLKRHLLILDECHTLESFLYEYATITVGLKQLKPLFEFMDTKDARDRLKRPFDSMDEFIQYIKDVIFPAFDRFSKSKAIEKKLEEKSPDIMENTIDAVTVEPKNEEERLHRLIAKLKTFIKEEPTDHSHVLVPDTALDGEDLVTVGLKIKPFSVASLSQLAFNSSDSRVLLMSATILDPVTFCKSVGISQEDAFFLRIPSTFPAENRLIIGDLSVGSMAYRSKDSTLPKMLDRILELSEKHGDQKGIIHTGNYEIMRKFQKWVKNADRNLHRRLLFQTQGSFEEKERLIGLHAMRSEPTILCGPGFLEGIDLKDDLARFNIIMKMPFLSLADPLIKRKAEEFPEWYSLQVALALIQAIGRPVRSKTDWALTYILDLLWKFFYAKHKDVLFPMHIQDAVRWVSTKNPLPFILK